MSSRSPDKEKRKKSPVLKDILVEVFQNNKLPQESLNDKQRKTMMDLMACHTPLCGYSKEVCMECGHVYDIHYGSCNNPNCPECGKVKQIQWEERLTAKLPKGRYYHIIFTVPDKILNPHFLYDPKTLDSMLFKAQAEALKQLSADPEYFGAKKVGFFSTLHSWSSNLNCHHHIHTLFCSTGLDGQDNLVVHSGNFLFPAKKLAQIFKNRFLDLYKEKFGDPDSPWYKNIQDMTYIQFNVEIRQSVDSPAHIVKYLGRYVNRTAISNGRIREYKDGKVTFNYKDYKAGGRKKGGIVKQMTLDDHEFVRRFLMHVPPPYFSRIRYYGFLAGNQGKQLERVKELTNTPQVSVRTAAEIIEELKKKKKAEGLEEELDEYRKKRTCRRCGGEIVTTVKERDKFQKAGITGVLSAIRYWQVRKTVVDTMPDTHGDITQTE